MKRAKLPDDMDAVLVREGRLVAARLPLPLPGAGQVLVRVFAAGINRPDLLQRRGLYPPPPGVTEVPGLEIAGEIVRGKPSELGRIVCALVPGGGYAEYCLADRALCLRLPRKTDAAAAAALPETFFTAWRNLFDVGGLKAGETVLVHGGASGVGVAAIQLARAFGARVITTAGNPRKLAACKRLGATLAVNYRTQDFVAEVLRETKGRGVDLVLDMVGGDYLARNLKCLAPGGRHVSIAAMKGRMAEADLLEIMRKRLVVTGSVLRPLPVAEKAGIARALEKKVWPLLDKGKIRPVVDKIFPLARAQDAHDWLEAGGHVGKGVLRVAAARR